MIQIYFDDRLFFVQPLPSIWSITQTEFSYFLGACPLPNTLWRVGGRAEIFKFYNYWIDVVVIKTISLNRKKI